MKGTHISKKTQRRLIKADDVDSLGIHALTKLVDEQRVLLSQCTRTVAWSFNAHLMRRANRAREILGQTFGI